MAGARLEAAGVRSGQVTSGQVTSELLDLSLGCAYSAALHTAARFDIADHLADSPRTADALAAAAGVHGPHLYRLLRFFAAKGDFREDDEGRFPLTPLAEPLRTDTERSLRDCVVVREKAAFRQSAGHLHATVRTGTTASESLYGVPFHDHVAADPAFGRAFHSSMAAFLEALSDDVAGTCGFSAAGSASTWAADAAACCARCRGATRT